MKRRFQYCILAVIMVIVTLVGACGSKTTTTTTGITIALGGQPVASMDPSTFNGGGGGAGTNNVFETLINFDANNKIIPDLAASWSFSTDGKILEMKLNKGIKFSSGDPFTAQDVVFSLERNGKNNMAIIDQLSQNFDRVEAVDDYTVRFYFPKVNVQFLGQTIGSLFILSKTYHDRVGEDAFVKTPVGTGPYKIDNWKEGQYVDLVYNENYRGKKPQIQKAHFVYAAEGSTRVSMLQAGEADIITEVPWTTVNTLQKAGYSRVDVPMPHDIVLQFGLINTKTPWSNVKVRQAIDYAIDKDALIKTLFGGVPKEGVWLLPWELGYDSSLKPAYKYDLAKAKQLMQDAGYASGFEMPIIYPTFVSWGKDVVDYVSSALKQIGITVKLTTLSGFPDFMDTIRKMHDDATAEGVIVFDVGWPGNPDPVINLTNGFYSVKPNSVYHTPQLDALIAQALETADNTARAAILKQAYKLVDADLPFIPICLEVTSSSMKSGITFKQTMGGLNVSGPTNLIDLTVK